MWLPRWRCWEESYGIVLVFLLFVLSSFVSAGLPIPFSFPPPCTVACGSFYCQVALSPSHNPWLFPPSPCILMYSLDNFSPISPGLYSTSILTVHLLCRPFMSLGLGNIVACGHARRSSLLPVPRHWGLPCESQIAHLYFLILSAEGWMTDGDEQ